MKLPPILHQYAEPVERALHATFAEQSFPLYQLLEYQLGWRDEQGVPLDHPAERDRLYPALCLAACQAVGGATEKSLPAATALELVDSFFQVHADVQDGSQERYGRPTVWWVWGPGQAINVGDAFHALARLSLMRMEEQGVPSGSVLQAIQALDAASLRVCEGLHLDLVYQERLDITADAYLEMAREKVGALVGCALELGSLAASASSETAQVLRDFGDDLGVACQVQKDIHELWAEPESGNTKGIQLLNKRKSLPIVYALDEGSISQKRALGNVYFKRVLEAQDLDQIRSVLDSLDARAYAQQTVERLLGQALRRLDNLGIPPTDRSDLEGVARFLAQRET